MEIILFGQLAEIAGHSRIEIDPQTDTDGLVECINKKYPAMMNIRYQIALNKKVVNSNSPIIAGSTIALLPPFSGG